MPEGFNQSELVVIGMYVIVVGAGTYGEPLTTALVEEGHDVVVIEEDEEIASSVTAEVDAMVLHGDATDEEMLEEAGIEQADFLISTISEDSVNVLVTLLAREYDTGRIVAVATSSKYESILERVGADLVERPRELLAERLSRYISNPSIDDVFRLGDNKEVIKIPVAADSKIVGKEVRELTPPLFPAGALLVAITNEDESVEIPAGDSTIHADDVVTVACDSNDVNQIEDLLRNGDV